MPAEGFRIPIVPETQEMERALARLGKMAESAFAGHGARFPFLEAADKLVEKFEKIQKISERIANTIGRAISSSAQGAVNSLISAGGMAVPGLASIAAIGGAAFLGGRVGAHFAPQGAMNVIAPGRNAIERLMNVPGSLQHAFQGSHLPERQQANMRRMEALDRLRSVASAQGLGDLSRVNEANLTTTVRNRMREREISSDSPVAAQLAEVDRITRRAAGVSRRDERKTERVQIGQLDIRELRLAGMAGGAGSALLAGAGVSGILRGAIGGSAFAPLGGALAQRFGVSPMLGAGVAGALGRGTMEGIISQAQAMLPMAMEFGANRGRANISGFGDFMDSRRDRRTATRMGFSQMELAQELAQMGGQMPGGLTLSGGLDITSLARGAGTGIGGLAGSVEGMVRGMGGFGIYRPGSDLEKTGAAGIRGELLERVMTDAVTAGYERNIPEFGTAVSQATSKALEPLILNAQQALLLQKSISTNTASMSNRMNITAGAASAIVGTAVGAPVRAAQMFMGGAMSQEQMQAVTYNAATRMGGRPSDQYDLVSRLMNAGKTDQGAAEFLYGSMGHLFQQGTSRAVRFPTASSYMQGMGFNAEQSYRLFSKAEDTFQAGGQKSLTLDDFKRIFGLEDIRGAAGTTETLRGLQERGVQLMEESGDSLRRMAGFQNQQLALAQQLANIGMASLTLEQTATSALVQLVGKQGQAEMTRIMGEIQRTMREVGAAGSATQGDALLRLLRNIGISDASLRGTVQPGGEGAGGAN